MRIEQKLVIGVAVRSKNQHRLSAFVRDVGAGWDETVVIQSNPDTIQRRVGAKTNMSDF